MSPKSLILLLPLLISPALAGSLPQMSGDPQIDAQWAAQLRRPPAVDGGGASIDLTGRRTTPAVFAPKPTHKRSVDPAFLPAEVEYPTSESAGTIVIDTQAHYLYLVLSDGRAERYGVGVGREGFGWNGTVKVGRKAEWPTWTPPAEMRERQPYLPASMPGGPDNPLGARAMYLYDGDRDTLFRIHGSNEPWTIGHNVSSGCIRMRNEDVTALYARVPIGTKVVVL
jgi:lipoprotein-anchoring transpeptidase ErfK/SrfK